MEVPVMPSKPQSVKLKEILSIGPLVFLVYRPVMEV